MRALVLLALALTCRRAPSHVAARPLPPPAPVAPSLPPPPPPAAPGWTAAFRLRHRPLTTHALADVVVHAPPGFDPRRPIEVVMLFHGLGVRASWWVVQGPLAPVTGEPGSGWGLALRHDRARVNALLVVPQLQPRGLDNFSGAFQRTGFLREFLSELLEETLVERLGGRHTLDDVGAITMVGSSAGGSVIAGLLARRDLADRVRNVVVVDGLYGSGDAFAGWMRRATPAAPRRFVCLYAGGAEMRVRADALAARLRAQHADVATQPAGALTDAVRDHAAVFATANCEHVGMANALYDKVIPALGLTPRAPTALEPTRTPAAPVVVPAGALVLGAPAVHGSLAQGDALLDDWTLFDDWILPVTAGQRVRVDLRGGRTRSILCGRHDVEVSVLDDATVLAHDDDSGGALNARAGFTAARDGTVTVRVMEHDAWAVEGEYTVRATATSPAAPATVPSPPHP